MTRLRRILGVGHGKFRLHIGMVEFVVGQIALWLVGVAHRQRSKRRMVMRQGTAALEKPSMKGKAGCPLDLVAQAVPTLSRPDLEALAERLINCLDISGPDPDLEPNGDESDWSAAEDEEGPHKPSSAPGCSLADGLEDDDEDCCATNEDRGSGGMPNARFNGYSDQAALNHDPDCENWFQPVHLN